MEARVLVPYSLVHNLYRILSFMAGQTFRYNYPRHRSLRLVADFLAIHDPTHRTLDVHVLHIVLLADYQFVQTLQMHQMLAPTQRYGWILWIVTQFFQAHWTWMSVRILWRIDYANKSTDCVTGCVDT